MSVYEVISTEEFRDWFNNLKDPSAISAVASRILRVQHQGNFGDFKNLGGGLYELRFIKRKGYRIYYTVQGSKIVLLLYGGDKSKQNKDIELARKILKRVEE